MKRYQRAGIILLVIGSMIITYLIGTMTGDGRIMSVSAQGAPSAISSAQYVAISAAHDLLLDQIDHQVYLPVVLK